MAQATEAPRPQSQTDSTEPGLADVSLLDLAWDPVPTATAYELRLQRLGSSKPPVRIQTQDTALSKELPTGSYQVEIRSIDPDGLASSWSAPLRVEVQPLIMDLISPQNGQSLPAESEKRQKITFRWKKKDFAKEYILRVWSEKNGKIYRTTSQAPQKAIYVTPEKRYFWQIYVVNKQGIKYESRNPPHSFFMLGQKLVEPKITKVDTQTPPRIHWQKSPKAEAYQLRLFRRDLLSTEWQLLKTLQIPAAPTTQTMWQAKKSLSPGEYRAELSAQSQTRPPSETVEKVFLVKPGLNDLADINSEE